MRKPSLIILITLIVILSDSCSVNNNVKLKKINTSTFKIKYPKSWVRFGSFEHIALTPKKLKKLNPQDELNNIAVSKNVIYADKFEDIGKTLDLHCNTLTRSEAKKDYKIIKMHEGSRFICKVESTVEYEHLKEKYKRVEYFYSIDGKLDYLRVQMKTDLFDIYENEIMLVINSFEPKK